MNRFGDFTFDEFGKTNTDVGKFRKSENVTNKTVIPRDFTRGELPVNTNSPSRLDLSSGYCPSYVRDDQTNSGSASAVISSVEHCLCQAANTGLDPRSVQQVSSCTDGLGLDVGTQMERVNVDRNTGFPDVHMSYIVSSLDGILDSEANIPEDGGCQTANSVDKTSARVTDYIADYFTTEDYLIDSLSLYGPTVTNMAVTPKLQFYGGGLYYNPHECQDYIKEEVPLECRETRGGRASFTCLNECADLMPLHCDIFFKEKYQHSLTAVGYGDEDDGSQYWHLKNSWGEGWGEGGYIRIARGLGHCSVGTSFIVPQCS